MVQRPNALGLVPSEMVIVEERTRNVTLVNSFQRRVVEDFPSSPQRFVVYTVLTDGLGEMTLTLRISRIDTLEDVYSRSSPFTVTDPLRQQRLWWRVRSCSFPVPGRYEIALLANEELITQCVIRVARREPNNG